MSNSTTPSRQSYASLPIHFLEPSSNLVREHVISARLKNLEDKKYEQIDTEEIKNRLKSTREENVANNAENVKRFRNLLQKKGIKSFYAETANDAAKYIEDVLHESKLNTICINNSTVVREALQEIGEGFEIVDTYNASYREKEELTPINYWELPESLESQIWNSFDIFGFKYKESHNFAALLGINAASSKEGSLFFVQHFRNIKNLMEMAKVRIFLISIEKIVGDFAQGLLISKSAGLFGIKSILLGIPLGKTKYKEMSMEQITDKFEKVGRSNTENDHVIILDNGRKDLLDSEFQEFLQCINCRACGSVCPRSLFGREEEYHTPRELVLLRFTGGLKKTVDQGLYNCSLCGGCKNACPLSIPLPDFLQKIRGEAAKNGLVPKRHLTLGENVKNFGNPYGRGEDSG